MKKWGFNPPEKDNLNEEYKIIKKGSSLKFCYLAENKADIYPRLPKLDYDKKLILVTGHRRENFGKGFDRICDALRSLASRNDIEIIYKI